MVGMQTRRGFLAGAAALGGAGLGPGLLPAWARSGAANAMKGLSVLSGAEFDLSVAASSVEIEGRRGRAVTVNGQFPAPLLRWREGEAVTLRVTNHLDADTSIHWHGLLLPYRMDGVPGVSFPGIAPGETFVYRFPLRQAGTYWYHSHSGLQEQLGHYGPIVIEPAGADPVGFDREYVIVLSDWTFMDPHRLFDKLMKNGESLNYQKRTFGDLVRDIRADGLRATLRDRMMWGRMRMSPTDIADVTGATYSYLVNGHGPAENWTALFEPGERVRLRVINASAMTIFNLRIPGLAMTVVQADGLDVAPVEVDEFQIGVAETYDVVVQPQADEAHTLMAETIDRSGYARATLAPREGMEAEIPRLRPRPVLTMRDMGMDHGAMGHDEPDHAAMGRAAAPAEPDHAAMGHGQMDHAAMGHGRMGRDMPITEDQGPQRHDHARGPGVANVAAAPSNRLSEAGTGLDGVSHRVLRYSDLRSLAPNPDRRPPARELEIHLTGNMERYMWSLDGLQFSEIVAPIRFFEGERLRLTLVNDTMMNHPIHLHGMFFDVVNGQGGHKPRKHTIIVKPAEKLSVDVTADAPGEWAFHCHLLYHMHAGMMQTVRVAKREETAP